MTFKVLRSLCDEMYNYANRSAGNLAAGQKQMPSDVLNDIRESKVTLISYHNRSTHIRNLADLVWMMLKYRVMRKSSTDDDLDEATVARIMYKLYYYGEESINVLDFIVRDVIDYSTLDGMMNDPINRTLIHLLHPIYATGVSHTCYTQISPEERLSNGLCSICHNYIAGVRSSCIKECAQHVYCGISCRGIGNRVYHSKSSRTK